MWNRELTQKEAARIAIEAMNRMALPPIGDDAKTYPVVLTEPEINTIHAACGFIRAACAASFGAPKKLSKFWKHYGPTLEALSERLKEFDD
jgi:hypothetical protein